MQSKFNLAQYDVTVHHVRCQNPPLKFCVLLLRDAIIRRRKKEKKKERKKEKREINTKTFQDKLSNGKMTVITIVIAKLSIKPGGVVKLEKQRKPSKPHHFFRSARILRRVFETWEDFLLIELTQLFKTLKE